MSDMDLGFSMRMEDEDSVPTPPIDMFAIRPDTKGPKSVAVLIIPVSYTHLTLPTIYSV